MVEAGTSSTNTDAHDSARALAPPSGPRPPQIDPITVADIFRAMASSLRDMQRAPLYSLPFGLAYAAFGWIILYLMIARGWGSYAYPLATGFPLVAPVAAAGLYEISRRLENGQSISFAPILGGMFSANGKALGIMIVVATFAYIIWLDIAAAIYVAFWGMKTMTVQTLIEALVLTPKGLVFLAFGNLVGALLALGIYSIMAISLPIIFDRNVDFVTAMITSVKAVLKNPKPMLVWCGCIGVLLFLSLVSLFGGLLVVFPFLGHTTWHVYKKVVLPPQG